MTPDQPKRVCKPMNEEQLREYATRVVLDHARKATPDTLMVDELLPTDIGAENARRIVLRLKTADITVGWDRDA